MNEIEKEAELLSRSFEAMMLQDAGRRVLTWLLEQTHVYQSSFAQDKETTEFLEGERNIGLKMLQRLNDFPRTYLAMLEKNLDDEELNRSNDNEDDELGN